MISALLDIFWKWNSSNIATANFTSGRTSLLVHQSGAGRSFRVAGRSEPLEVRSYTGPSPGVLGTPAALPASWPGEAFKYLYNMIILTRRLQWLHQIQYNTILNFGIPRVPLGVCCCRRLSVNSFRRNNELGANMCTILYHVAIGRTSKPLEVTGGFAVSMMTSNSYLV